MVSERSYSLVCSIDEHEKCDGNAPNGPAGAGNPCNCDCHDEPRPFTVITGSAIVTGRRGTNPRLSPRSTTCTVCRDVRELVDVNLRLWDEDGDRIPSGHLEVGRYLKSIGLAGSDRALVARAQRHRDHCERYADGQRRNVSAAPEAEVIVPKLGPARWLDVQQDAMDAGRAALARLQTRLESGTMEDKDVIALAKLGTTAAGKRADLEAKGRKLSQMDELLQLAAGLVNPQRQLTDGG